MASEPQENGPDRRRPSIVLQNLSTASEHGAPEEHERDGGIGRSYLAPLGAAQTSFGQPGISSYWDSSYQTSAGNSPSSAIDPMAFQAALPPDIYQPEAYPSRTSTSSFTQFDPGSAYLPPYVDETPGLGDDDSDRVPLTVKAQPISGALTPGNQESHARFSFQTVSDVDNETSRGRGAGYLGHDLESAHGSIRRSYRETLSPNRASYAAGTSGALQLAGSIVRAMSQRVVNISGEGEIADHRKSRHRSRSPHDTDRDHLRDTIHSTLTDSNDGPFGVPTAEKAQDQNDFEEERRPLSPFRRPAPNPLKGKTLGILSPTNKVRLWLCEVLLNPYTEPFILCLIVLQTILLAVEASPSVFSNGHGRPERWGEQAMDWAMLGLFIVFTLELVARVIVSGFLLNAADYSTIDRKKGFRAAIADQYQVLFQPERHKSVRGNRQAEPEPGALARSFTTLMQGQQSVPQTFKEQQRFQLARRAFLRHSFNRLDFVAVLSFWISFVLGITGIEHEYRIYVFKMLSCLRILKLLALTHGTAIILRSLKKAAPLLARVAFLIGFFWIVFALIGAQSFRSSLARTCVWRDPSNPNNLSAAFTREEDFCGGYKDVDTGTPLPWVRLNGSSLADIVNGTSDPKGYICPRGSICLEQDNPQNGTVNFDNILNSLELVFVIMSANTFSDIMYATMASDYTQSALFFGAGIMIMTLWLTNLLIAVITSSFQVIREESKSSAFTSGSEPPIQLPQDPSVRQTSSLRRLYEHSQSLWVLIITFGLISQAFRSATMSDNREHIIDLAEMIVTFILDIEILIRIAIGWRDFGQSWKNIFDLALAVITSIILIPGIRGTRAYDWLTVFQILRVYRVVLAIPVTRTLILLVLGNAAGIANQMLFVVLMTFFVAIFASQLFRGDIPIHDDGDFNQVSFYSLWNSFVGIYQVLTSENWTSVLYGVTGYLTPYGTSWIGAVFLIGWFILSFFILMNMFIAVIQENFDVSEDEKRLEQVKAFLQKKELGTHASSNLSLFTIFSLGRARRRRDPLDYGPAMMEMLLKDAVVRDFLDDHLDHARKQELQHVGTNRHGTFLLGDVKPGSLSNVWGKLVSKFKSNPNPFYSNIRFDGPNDTLDPRQMARQVVDAASARRRAQREYLARHPSYNTSLYIFHPKNRIRHLCQRLVGPARGVERFDGVEPNKLAWYSFSAFIYASIVAMVIIACVTTPLYQKEYQEEHAFSFKNWYVWTDMAFTVVFTTEAIIKIIADGFIWTPNAYLRSSWGIIDSVVLVTLWINVVTLLINDGAISRAVGAFKALRALRLLNVSDSSRDTFHSLIIVGWWKIVGAAAVSISLLIPFAIYGLNLFNGQLDACNDGDDITQLNACWGEFSSIPYSDDWPLLAPRVATTSFLHFDDFAASLFTLFQVVSQEGWADITFGVQAITGRGLQPEDLASEGNAVFFIIFNVMSTVFILTLFISIFMRNYTEETGVAFLTAEQRSWLELRKILRQVSPSKSSYDASEKTWKKWCHKRAIEKRGTWYQSMTAVLVLHLLLLLVEYRGEPELWTRIREFLFLVLIVIYGINISIRIVGLGWRRFRKSSWDLYSLFTVFGSFVAILALFVTGSRDDTLLQFHKYFLTSIVLLLIPRNDALDQLFKTAVASLTVIGSLLATWLIFFLVFAIATTQAFSLTRFGMETSSNVNFRTVPNALLLLFRMSFGEGWNAVMEDYADIEPPLCVEADRFFDSDCGSKPWARFLFVAWNIVSMYIFVNLFVSLIYESFSYVYQRSSSIAVVDRDEIRRFKEAWRTVDPEGTGYIQKEAFPRLLAELSGVFQMRIYDPEDSISRILEDVREEDSKANRHMSITAKGGNDSIDINKLKERLAQIDSEKIRQRRHRFNVFYDEVMVTADPDRGIGFTSVLMILAHYNIITDSKSLKLEEFLKRRARLQRVEDEVRRKTVQGFFYTVYWTRKFKKHLDRQRASRMMSVPSIEIPDMFVDVNVHGQAVQETKTRSRPSLADGNLRLDTTNLGGTPSQQARDSVHQHPLSFPTTSGFAASSATAATSRKRGDTSAFSFELEEPEGQQQQPEEMGQRGSGLSPTTPSRIGSMLDESVWIETLRRSTTQRRSDYGRGSYPPPGHG
ncbi:Ion transport protein-domain-containing protein [Stachybotrys elegans]|uniref:Calcium-channel protein CCH1 n=1 Tax=Stachybotrys elegans TaxID=80388 RepID=A0A8K0WVK4_9HYPO|nr:Ion transport protein-domain-containing protein [Stachybotrys elegans]